MRRQSFQWADIDPVDISEARKGEIAIIVYDAVADIERLTNTLMIIRDQLLPQHGPSSDKKDEIYTLIRETLYVRD